MNMDAMYKYMIAAYMKDDDDYDDNHIIQESEML